MSTFEISLLMAGLLVVGAIGFIVFLLAKSGPPHEHDAVFGVTGIVVAMLCAAGIIISTPYYYEAKRQEWKMEPSLEQCLVMVEKELHEEAAE